MRFLPVAVFLCFLASCVPDEQQAGAIDTIDSTTVQESEVDTFIVGGKGTLSEIESAKGESLKLENDSALQSIRYEIIGTDENEDAPVLSHSASIERNPDVGPSFPGGSLAMDKYIADHLIYPLVAFQNEVEGTVQVRFVVETDGRLTGIIVQKGLGYGCDESAVDLIKGMPKWTPGRKGGVNVRCSVVLPITFGKKNAY